MPITVKYAPVGALLGLAQAAGIGERRRRDEMADLAFIQMSLSAQARNAEIAARTQARDQAFALQTAAAVRIARTPTRVQPTDAVLGRMQWQVGQEELQRETQIDQLNMMRAGGQIDQAQYERAKLGLMTDNEALVRGALLPKITKRPTVTFAQEKSYFDDRWRRQLDPLEREIRQLQKEVMADYDIRDKEGKVVPELQQQEGQRVTKINNRLNALRIQYNDLQKMRDQEWETFKQTQQPTGQRLVTEPTGAARPVAEAPQAIPLPPQRAMWAVGQVYVAPDGRLGRWNGQTFESVER